MSLTLLYLTLLLLVAGLLQTTLDLEKVMTKEILRLGITSFINSLVRNNISTHSKK